jgi:excinuclease ABC subunit B
MRSCLDETSRRRDRQASYNRVHGITPQTIVKNIEEVLGSVYEADYPRIPSLAAEPAEAYGSAEELEAAIAALETEMRAAATELDFERAATLRDRVRALKRLEITR